MSSVSKFASRFSMSLKIVGLNSCQMMKVSLMNFASSFSLYIVSSFIISIWVRDRAL